MSHALASHRKRLADAGWRRVEVYARADDAHRLRLLAKALRADDERARELRERLDAELAADSRPDPKQVLMSMPQVEGFDELLERDRSGYPAHREIEW